MSMFLLACCDLKSWPTLLQARMDGTREELCLCGLVQALDNVLG